MRPRSVRHAGMLLGVCLASCVAIACGDDDDGDGSPGDGGSGGKGGSAGAAMTEAGDSAGGKAGGGGSAGKGGTAGGPGEMPEGGAGGAPVTTPDGFTAFVHDLIQNQTADTNAPAALEPFDDPTDERGHYLVPDDAFDDLF